MFEAFSLYQAMSPLQIGILLFLLGTVAGSFASVVAHRVPAGRSIVGPRSRCHTCGHALRGRDLVPVLSFLWLRGRCRYCRAPISWRYPLLELSSGLLAGTAGAAGGWSAGFAAVACWVGAVWVNARRRPQAGSTLVEVLLAVALLGAAVIPLMNLAASLQGVTPFQRQMAVAVATTKLEELGSLSYRTANWPGPSGQPEEVQVGRFLFRVEWTVGTYVPAVDDYTAEGANLKKAEVTVTCMNCTRSMSPVRMVAVLGKL